MSESRFQSLRNAFLTGLVLVAPLVATMWVLGLIIRFVGGSITPLFKDYLPAMLRSLPLVWELIATVIALGLVTLLGYLSRVFLGRLIGEATERFIHNIPGIGSFYNSVKQFIATFGAKGQAQFSKVVLVQFPRPGAWTIGFVTNTSRGEPHAHLPAGHWAVFVPTCPSPVNGFFMYLPAAEVVELEMSVGDGMKTVISCGAVLPTWHDPAVARAALKSAGFSNS